jgi:hypothetical protein
MNISNLTLSEEQAASPPRSYPEHQPLRTKRSDISRPAAVYF